MKFEPGNLYKITYRQQGGNYRWYRYEMTAVYLGHNTRKDERLFSLRPLAGTTALSIEHNPIEAVELVEENIPYKYRGGVRDLKVPVRRPRSLGVIKKEEL